MGFFQDLKEDLSLAVNELIPEETAEKAGEQQELEEDTSMDEAMKEMEAVLSEEFGQDAESEMVSEAGEEQEPEEEDEFPSEKTQEDRTGDDEPETDESEAETDEAEVAEPGTDREPEDDSGEMENPGEVETIESEEAETETKDATAEPFRSEESNSSSPIIDAAAAQIASIANIVAKEDVSSEYEEREMQSLEELFSRENVTDTEETELEKEVGMAMAEQKVDLAMEEAVDETAVITAGMTVTGNIISKGSIDILGKVEGTVEVLGKLNVSGTIEGDSKAAEVFADSAHITGKVTAEGTIKIGQNSVIIGDIEASSAVIAGAVKGDIDVKGPVILDASAIVMGNIKSKSVQINNGAVIEGMCSQCYAEVNPTSFFDELIQK